MASRLALVALRVVMIGMRLEVAKESEESRRWEASRRMVVPLVVRVGKGVW